MAGFTTEILQNTQENGYSVFKLLVRSKQEKKEYSIYIAPSDLPKNIDDLSSSSVFAEKEMSSWIQDSGGKLPKEKYRILVNGGKITTDDIDVFFSIKKKSSDLIRTNITISASLFEWTKDKAKKENTSFSDLINRGITMLRDADKETEAWFKEQGSYFRKKLGSFGSFEVFHYLPNNYEQFSQDVLKESLQKAELRRTGWPIGVYLNSDQRPIPQEDGIKAEYDKDRILSFDYWYTKNKGEFYFSRILESDNGNGTAKPGTSLYFDTLVWRVAESIEHCIAFYKNLEVEDSEKIKLKLSLYGLSNRILSAWNPGRAFSLSHYKCGSDTSSWELEITLKELSQDLDEIIYEAVKKMLVLFDFFVPNKEVVLDILNNEYRRSSI